MKKIEILQHGLQPISVLDKDDTKLNEYTNEISKLLKSGNISILETTTCNIVLRPQHIYSILVSEINDESEDVDDSIEQEPIIEEQQDIIIG